MLDDWFPLDPMICEVTPMGHNEGSDSLGQHGTEHVESIEQVSTVELYPTLICKLF